MSSAAATPWPAPPAPPQLCGPLRSRLERLDPLRDLVPLRLMEGELLPMLCHLLRMEAPPFAMKRRPLLELGQHLGHGKCRAHPKSPKSVANEPSLGRFPWLVASHSLAVTRIGETSERRYPLASQHYHNQRALEASSCLQTDPNRDISRHQGLQRIQKRPLPRSITPISSPPASAREQIATFPVSVAALQAGNALSEVDSAKRLRDCRHSWLPRSLATAASRHSVLMSRYSPPDR